MTDNRQNQETRNNDYINQKPQYNRKSLVISGVSFAAFAILVLSLVLATVDHFRQTTIDEIAAENSAKELAGEFVESNKPEAPMEDVAKAPAIPNDELEEVEPAYDEESIELALYKVTLHDDTLIEPSDDGTYQLEPGTVYAIWWHAFPLIDNDEEKMRADIDISSDYFVEEGTVGQVTLSARDYRGHVLYSGELAFAPTEGNLGIEFCSDECRIRSYGFYPDVMNRSDFIVCFYTSGEFVEHEYGSISGVHGLYSYTYGTIGHESEYALVTIPEKTEEVNIVTVSNQSPKDKDLMPEPPIPDPNPPIMDEPPMPEPAGDQNGTNCR